MTEMRWHGRRNDVPSDYIKLLVTIKHDTKVNESIAKQSIKHVPSPVPTHHKIGQYDINQRITRHDSTKKCLRDAEHGV